jgi:hypothetical protein
MTDALLVAPTTPPSPPPHSGSSRASCTSQERQRKEKEAVHNIKKTNKSRTNKIHPFIKNKQSYHTKNNNNNNKASVNATPLVLLFL